MSTAVCACSRTVAAAGLGVAVTESDWGSSAARGSTSSSSDMLYLNRGYVYPDRSCALGSLLLVSGSKIANAA